MSLFERLRLFLFGRRRYEEGEAIRVYRCTECGYVAFSLGGLHGHIEGHRPTWKFWKVGSPGFLMDRTQEMRLEPIDIINHPEP